MRMDFHSETNKMLQPFDTAIKCLQVIYRYYSIIGTSFYLMQYVRGKVLQDFYLPELTPDQRRQVNVNALQVLARIHKVNIADAGLSSFGKQGTRTTRPELRPILTKRMFWFEQI